MFSRRILKNLSRRTQCLFTNDSASCPWPNVISFCCVSYVRPSVNVLHKLLYTRTLCTVYDSSHVNHQANLGVNTSDESSATATIECSCDSVLLQVKDNFHVVENFITIQDQTVLLKEIEKHFKGHQYEYDHWDDAIHGYRETEKSRWSPETQGILQRVRDAAFEPGASQLPLVHVIDLAENGYIKAHVDSIKFCGPTIAGISLVSASVMKLVNEKDNTQWVKALLSPGSLYIMRNKLRFDYTHEILKDEESYIKGTRIKRGRRVSVMFRDHPID